MKTPAFLLVGLAMLTACGGGGSGSGGGGNNASTAKPATVNASAFLFVANGNTATDYKIDPQTGALTAAGTPVAGGIGAFSIAVDPRGKFAYVDTSLNNAVLTYSINATTGDLTVVDGTGVPGGRDAVVMHPSGKFVYVVAPAVTGYLVDGQTGKLTPMSMPPLSVATMDPITSFAIAPDGRFAYMTTSDKKVVTLSIDQATGALSVAPGVPVVDGGTFPTAITIGADGKFLFFERSSFTSGVGVSTVVALSRDAVTGALTQVGEAPIAGGGDLSMIVDPTNKFLYVAASVTGILTYAFDQNSGALTAMGAPIATPDGGAAVSLVSDPSGKFAYVGSLFRGFAIETDNIWTAKIDSDTGAFTFFGQPTSLGSATYRFLITANISQ